MNLFQPFLAIALLVEWFEVVTSISSGFIADKHSNFQNSGRLISITRPDEFEALISEPRDYGTVLLLTATNPAFNCWGCQVFKGPFSQLAHSAANELGDLERDNVELIYAVMDFTPVMRETWVQLRISEAPVLFVVPPTRGRDVLDEYKRITGRFRFPFTICGSMDVHASHAWISSHLPSIEIPLDLSLIPRSTTLAPSNFARNLIAVILGIFCIFVAWVGIFWQRWFWGAAGMVWVALMSSGFMWVKIKNVFLTIQGQTIVPEMHAQLGIETIIMTILYLASSVSILSLSELAPMIPSAKVQKFVIIGGLIAFIYCYSLTLNIFRLKLPSYPFRLFL